MDAGEPGVALPRLPILLCHIMYCASAICLWLCVMAAMAELMLADVKPAINCHQYR